MQNEVYCEDAIFSSERWRFTKYNGIVQFCLFEYLWICKSFIIKWMISSLWVRVAHVWKTLNHISRPENISFKLNDGLEHRQRTVKKKVVLWEKQNLFSLFFCFFLVFHWRRRKQFALWSPMWYKEQSGFLSSGLLYSWHKLIDKKFRPSKRRYSMII